MPDKMINPWVTVLFVVVMQAITIGTAVYTFAFFIVPWMQTFEVSRTNLMIAATLSSATMAILSPFCGQLLDRFDSKKLLLGSLIVYCAGLMGISLASHYLIVVVLYGLILPIGLILAGPLMSYALVARTNIEKKGLAMGVVALGTSLGGLLMPPLVTHLLADYSWQSVWQILTAITLVVVFIPALFLVQKHNPQKPEKPTTSDTTSNSLWRSPSVIMLGFCYLAPGMLFMAILHNIGALAADMNIAQSQAATIIAGASIVMAIGKVAAGALSDNLNHRAMYLSIILLMALGTFITSFSSGYFALISGVCIIALSLGGVAPLIAAMVARSWAPEEFGRVMGIVHAFAACSGVGPLFAGYMRDVSGSYIMAFLSFLIPLAMAFIMFSFIRSNKHTTAAPI